MKYKVGDKVRVREDLVVNEKYGGSDFVNSMKPYMGKIMTISCVNSNTYYFKEDGKKWMWTDEMFENDVRSSKIISFSFFSRPEGR